MGRATSGSSGPSTGRRRRPGAGPGSARRTTTGRPPERRLSAVAARGASRTAHRPRTGPRRTWAARGERQRAHPREMDGGVRRGDQRSERVTEDVDPVGAESNTERLEVSDERVERVVRVDRAVDPGHRRAADAALVVGDRPPRTGREALEAAERELAVQPGPAVHENQGPARVHGAATGEWSRYAHPAADGDRAVCPHPWLDGGAYFLRQLVRSYARFRAFSTSRAIMSPPSCSKWTPSSARTFLGCPEPSGRYWV